MFSSGVGGECVAVSAKQLHKFGVNEEDGQGQQLGLNQVQDVEHPARAAIAVSKRVNRFKLVIAHGHADQGVLGVLE